MSTEWICPHPFSGMEEADLEAFLLDFDLACDANGWVVDSPLYGVTSIPPPVQPVAPAHLRSSSVMSRLSAHSEYDYVGQQWYPETQTKSAQRPYQEFEKNEHRCLLLLKRSLTGSAFRFLLTLPPEIASSYPALRKALTERYLPVEAQYVYRAKLRTCRREAGESISNLADRIQLLVARAYPRLGPLDRDDFEMEAFIQALGLPLCSRVRDGQPKTMKEALQRAQYLEAHLLADASFSEVVERTRNDCQLLEMHEKSREAELISRLCARLDRLESQLGHPAPDMCLGERTLEPLSSESMGLVLTPDDAPEQTHGWQRHRRLGEGRCNGHFDSAVAWQRHHRDFVRDSFNGIGPLN